MGAMSPTHWAIVIAVVVLLFGAKKMPDTARSIGRSMRIFTGEVQALHDDGAAAEAPATALPGERRDPDPTQHPAGVRRDQ